MKLHCNDIFKMNNENYEDIFSENLEKLIQISKICESAIRTRNVLMTDNA